LEIKEASALCGKAAANLILAMSSETNPATLGQLAEGLSAILNREEPATTRSRLAAVAAIASPGPRPLLAAPALLPPALTVPPPPLPAQDLVNLLKHPFCIARARRLELDQLQRHYHRPFVEQWDFVQFAQEMKLRLDLTAPPRRPD
jgi:hypothetical protein